MSLWNDLPTGITESGALDALEPVLDAVDTPASSTEADADGTWTVYTTSVGGNSPLSLDPSTGGFARGPGSGSTPIEFPDPRVGLRLRLHQAADTSPDGWVQLIVAAPKAIVRLPFLKGAVLDAQGQLRPDPANPDVKFHLPAVRFQIERPVGGALSFEVLSASTTTPVDEIYEFVRMEPPYALIGPSNAVGFAFRTAVLDLSGTSGPSGVPSTAIAMPTEWQGFYLPEARMFVSPSGMEGLAVSGGVRNLWIGIGDHAGVTGIFEAEIVNRGSAPTVRLRFQTPNGEWIGVPDTDPVPTVQLPEQSRLYVDAGGGLAPITTSITVGSTTTSGDRVDVTTPATGTVTISVTATDAGSHTTTRSITVGRRTTTATGVTPAGGSTDVRLQSTATGASRIELVGSTATNATLRVNPGGGTITWTWPGGTATGATAVVPVAAGATVTVTATRSLLTEVNCFMLFDRPENRRADIAQANADNPVNTRTEPAGRQDAFTAGTEFQAPASLARFNDYPAGTTWTVEGYASFEGDNSTTKQDYNDRLSERRRDALIRILQERTSIADSAITSGTAHGHAVARTSTTEAPGSGRWWRATATASLTVPSTETITADLNRPTVPPPVVDVDPAPTTPPRPDCFRKLGFRVELIRGTFVRAEVYGEFDIQTAAEQRLAANGAGPLPARTNPNDGIAQFLVRLRIAEDRSSWDVTAEFRAIEGDLDGLAKVEAPATGSSTGLNVLGAIAALAPLLAAATPPSPRDAELVPMIVATGVAIGLGASGVMTTKHVILRGGDLVVSDGLVDPASGTGPRTTQVSVMVDVETAFTFDLGFIRTRPDKPITARYKAVGVRSTWSSTPGPAGTIEYVPLPVFDPSRGYTLDLPEGSLVAADPLGEILRVLGVRVSRDNPTFIEVEVGLGIDLGIVTVDSARVRLRLDALEAPQLTKLAASLEIPGTLHGKGSVEITSTGFAGSFDLTITPVNLRVAATLAVSTVGGVTGVLIGAEVEFPVPIVLGNSGLGIFGFMGGVGVNFNRIEPTGVTAPALKWVEDQFRRPGGVMDIGGWQHSPGGFAFAAGMLVGTLEGGFVAHLKGIVLIELPGPRLLLIMKADVLKLPPVLDSDASATFLAVIDIDFGRGEITIGIVAEYSIKELLHIRIPVTAFFPTNPPTNWSVDLGTFNEPATVKVLDVIEGVGYVMVHGNGIPGFPVPVVTSGLTIGVGFHIRAVLMGSKSIGLYLEVAAGFDAVVSIKPFALGGIIYARGELRLFIISIGASAELTVLVGRQIVSGHEVDRTYIHGKVCGRVSFFFFSIEACLELTIGDEFSDPPPAPDLIAGVVLISRTPALIEGTAGDRAVDGKLADAIADGSGDPLPTVPLDSIPVVMFNHPTDELAGNIVLGGEARGASGLPANPWIRTGEWWFRYRLTSVTMTGPLLPPAGATPATWWARGLPGDSTHGPALALLNWTPDPTPQAVVYGEKLITTTTDRWGRICDEPAKPAPVLWTFDGEPLGPSSVGWSLDGVAWPDPDGTYRSSVVDARLVVTELWRSGDQRADQLQGTDPAVVIGDAVPCKRELPPIIDNLKVWSAGHPSAFSEGAVQYDEASFVEYGELIANGASLSDVVAARATKSWVPDSGNGQRGESYDCTGRILQSPDNDLDRPNSGDDFTDQEIMEAWEKQGFKPSDLQNAIRLHHAGGLEELTLLLLAPRSENEQSALVLRYFDRDGNLTNEEIVTPAHLVSAGNPVPSDWTDPGRPWADPVHRSGMIAARVAATKNAALFLVPCAIPSDTVTVELGSRRTDQDAPLFYVVAATALSATERFRHDWDSTTIKRERELIETTLAQDPDDHALLSPSAVYTINVKWESAAIKSNDRPAANAPVTWVPSGGTTQSFRFAADGADEAPADLNGWLLATTPGPDEIGLLCNEPVLIAFATQNVARLFDAYGEELRIVVRSASGKHPTPPGGSGPGAPLAIPIATGGIAKPLKTDAPVKRPWDQAIGEVVGDLPCINDAGTRVHHDVVTITYDFDPLTDYLLDVRAVPKGAPESAVGRRVHRLGFTTSRFDTAEEIAELVLDAPIQHDYLANISPIAVLATRPSGADLDAAIVAAGLDAPATPRYPRVSVLWNGAAEPQPVAVIIDSSERLWRERPMPTQVTDVGSIESPPPTWWVAKNTPWLEPQSAADLPAPGDPARTVVTRIIRAPGDSRAVVLLGANSRGTELALDLVVPSNALYAKPERRTRLFGLRLGAAPWEEEV